MGGGGGGGDVGSDCICSSQSCETSVLGLPAAKVMFLFRVWHFNWNFCVGSFWFRLLLWLSTSLCLTSSAEFTGKGSLQMKAGTANSVVDLQLQ